MKEGEASVAVSCGCRLGEGPVWDQRGQRLFWVDILAHAIWILEADGRTKRIEVPERLGFVALTPDENVLLTGFKSGLALYDLRDGAMRALVSPEPERTGNRINDGTVGPDGSVYFGTMDERERKATGSFWRYARGTLTRFGPPAVVTNGPAVAADGKRLYAVHSVARKIFMHRLSAGLPGEPELFAQFPAHWGYPDGLIVDAEDHLWVCHWGGSRVTRFRPDATVERVISVPTRQVTKCALGGRDFSTLYITTAQRGRPVSDKAAGHLFAYSTDVRGVPADIARID